MDGELAEACRSTSEGGVTPRAPVSTRDLRSVTRADLAEDTCGKKGPRAATGTPKT